MIHLGATLRRLRLESGLSLRDLARRLGVSSAYLSRVEHGLDPTPTAERLEAVAEELGLPATLLLEVGHRVSPFLRRYLEHEPQAGALFLEIARRGLGAEELAEVQRFVERRFPSDPMGSEEPSAHRLLSLLDVSRVVAGVHCAVAEDAYEVGSARLASLPGMPSAADLAAMFAARALEVGPGVGGGIAVLCAVVPAAEPSAAVVLLSPSLVVPTPDGAPLEVVILLVVPNRSRDGLLRIAHVARLGSRGLSTALDGLAHPEDVLRRIELLERVG